jgi:hypothetical protein
MMKKADLIEEIKYLIGEIRINLECCKLILKHLKKKNNNKWTKHIIAQDMYLYLLLNNHLNTALLGINILLNPSKAEKTTEISPFNPLLELKDVKQLRRIKQQLIDKGISTYRSKGIAHRENIHAVRTLRYFYTNGELGIFHNAFAIYKKLNHWIYKEFKDEPKVRTYRKGYLGDIKQILNYIDNYIAEVDAKNQIEAEKFANSLMLN